MTGREDSSISYKGTASVLIELRGSICTNAQHAWVASLMTSQADTVQHFVWNFKYISPCFRNSNNDACFLGCCLPLSLPSSAQWLSSNYTHLVFLKMPSYHLILRLPNPSIYKFVSSAFCVTYAATSSLQVLSLLCRTQTRSLFPWKHLILVFSAGNHNTDSPRSKRAPWRAHEIQFSLLPCKFHARCFSYLISFHAIRTHITIWKLNPVSALEASKMRIQIADGYLMC